MKIVVNKYLNVRQGSPSVNAACQSYLEPGAVVEVNETPVSGDHYEGNNLWYKDNSGNYYWSGGVSGVSPIKHVFVLMLENRSFDHMLGYAQIKGKVINGSVKFKSDGTIDGPQGIIDGINANNTSSNISSSGTSIAVSANADPNASMDVGPGHEFFDTLTQLTGFDCDQSDDSVKRLLGSSGQYPLNLNNSGFIKNYEIQKDTKGQAPKDIGAPLKCFAPESVPILTRLAKEFVVCDRWFSSLPGPTWPNRFFVHAGTSGGLDHSPTTKETILSNISGYKFDKGTIFSNLTENKLKWRIYAGSPLFPQVRALSGVHAWDIRDYKKFSEDITEGYDTAYTFIEPSWGSLKDFTGGNSQHPLDNVAHGESLVQEVFNTISSVPTIWNQSLLIITYDEHGGFFDHVKPESSVDPGGSKKYSSYNFDFKTYGVRVPAVVISPLIEGNLIDKRVFDHTSILATIERIFGLPNLTERDKVANHFCDLIKEGSPRVVNTVKVMGENSGNPSFNPSHEADFKLEDLQDGSTSIDSSLAGFLHIAAITDSELNPDSDITQRLNEVTDKKGALAYIQGVYNASSVNGTGTS